MTREILGKISRLASQNPFYLGWHLARYSEYRGVSMEELSNQLGCLPQAIVSMSLCRAPREDAPHFQNDIERVAERFQARAYELMRIVRHSQLAFEEERLLAARDRDPEESEDSEPDG